MDKKSLLQRLVETESPSHQKAAVDRVGAIVAEQARTLGAQVEILPNDETGDHILAHFSSAVSGASSSILLLCHMDTVFPLGTIEKFPYREVDGKITGPGTLDMKAGIVIALAAMAGKQRHPLRRRAPLSFQP